MTRLVGSELFKLRTTRTFYGLTLISLGLILVIVSWSARSRTSSPTKRS